MTFAMIGASAGWHIHPAAEIFYIVNGTLTITYNVNCKSIFKTIKFGHDSSYIEAINVPHITRNLGDESVIAYAIYLGAKGLPAIIFTDKNGLLKSSRRIKYKELPKNIGCAMLSSSKHSITQA